MCMPTPSRSLSRADQEPTPPPPRNAETVHWSYPLLVIQSSFAVVLILSILAYLVQDPPPPPLVPFMEQPPQTNRSTLLPYLVVSAFLFHVPRNLLSHLVRRLRKRLSRLWNKSVVGGMPTSSSLSLPSLSSSQALVRLSRVSSSVCQTLAHYSHPWRSTLQAVTRRECFAKLDYIQQLSIADLSILFRYATDVNQVDFDKKTFLSSQPPLIRALITAMDMAVSISRGSMTLESSRRQQRHKQGDVDALYFVAVTRIFAEWRTLRLVPRHQGHHKRYEVALNLAHRDVLQNLVKMEHVVHAYFLEQVRERQSSSSSSSSVIRSPTLRDLLQHETTRQVHARLPRLVEKSAASGLLWTKRQIQYQTCVFRNSLQVPLEFSCGRDAALAAYQEIYDSYHGWAVKQIFFHSFGGSPPLERIWKTMIPPTTIASTSDGTSDSDSMMERKLSDVSDQDGSEDNEFLKALEEALGVFGKQVGNKWDEFLGLFHCGKDKEGRRRDNTFLVSSESYLRMPGVEAMSSSLSSSSSSSSMLLETIPSMDSQENDDNNDEQLVLPPPTVDTVKRDTAVFVQEMEPLLQELTLLFDEFNMNDPTRV